MAPIREGLHLLLETELTDLPDGARILCLGAVNGTEISHLAQRSPR